MRTTARRPKPGTPDLDVYVMRADGTGIRRVTTDPGNDHDPSWLPDGGALVFSSDRASRGDLYRVRVADGQTDRLTTNFVGRAIMPAVSPDGAEGGLRRADAAGRRVLELPGARARPRVGRAEPRAGSGGACWPVLVARRRALYNVQLDREPSSIQRRDLSRAR